VDPKGAPTVEFQRKWLQQTAINQGIPDTAEKASAVLDLLGNTSGDILVRGTALWEVETSPGNTTVFLNGNQTYAAVKDSDLSLGNITTNDVSTTKHGFAPRATGNTTIFLNGNASYAAVKDSDLSLGNITTNNVSTTAHGFAPRATGDATIFLNGNASYAAVKDSDLSLGNITTNNVSTAKHGFAPILPNDSTKFLDGTGAYSVPPGIGGGSGTGGWFMYPQLLGASDAAFSYATKGNTFRPLQDMYVTHFIPRITTVAGATYRATIYVVNSSDVIQSILADSADFASPGAVTGAMLVISFGSSVHLVAGTYYVIAVRRTDGGDTYALPLYGTGTTNLGYTGAPLEPDVSVATAHRAVRCPKAVPAVSDTFSSSTNGYFTIGVKMFY
jgi:hypothetical protein